MILSKLKLLATFIFLGQSPNLLWVLSHPWESEVQLDFNQKRNYTLMNHIRVQNRPYSYTQTKLLLSMQQSKTKHIVHDLFNKQHLALSQPFLTEVKHLVCHHFWLPSNTSFTAIFNCSWRLSWPPSLTGQTGGVCRVSYLLLLFCAENH